MEFETERYRFEVTELNEGGPGGYESIYLTSEGNPASPDLYKLFDDYHGSLLAARNEVLRQRNGKVLVTTLAEDRPAGIASGFKPSGAYHFGHKLTSGTVGFFQENGIQVFVPVADVESEMDPKLTREEYQFWAADNLLDWGANGVDLETAHVYLQSEEFRVNTLSYIVARSLRFDLAVDIYGADKIVNVFPFLFAGITQVGDILLPQHKDFGNHHSFMVSGQDQDGHMKMTVELTKATLERETDLMGVSSIPSGLYIPHIRGISGDKASSSKADSTIYLGQGPNYEDIDARIKSSMSKIDRASKEHLSRCSLDMVRYIEYFNAKSNVQFEELCKRPQYISLVDSLEKATTSDDRAKIQTKIDQYLISECEIRGQSNEEIVRDNLAEALKDHRQKREVVLEYALSKASSPNNDDEVQKPSFWNTPSQAAVVDPHPNPTKWFHIIANSADKLIP